MNECLSVYMCVNVVIGSQSDVGAHKGSNPCRTKCNRLIELNLLAQLPFLSLPSTEKSNSKAVRQRAPCAPVSLSPNLRNGL